MTWRRWRSQDRQDVEWVGLHPRGMRLCRDCRPWGGSRAWVGRSGTAHIIKATDFTNPDNGVTKCGRYFHMRYFHIGESTS